MYSDTEPAWPRGACCWRSRANAGSPSSSARNAVRLAWICNRRGSRNGGQDEPPGPLAAARPPPGVDALGSGPSVIGPRIVQFGETIAIGGTSAGAITALNVGYNPDDPGTSGNPGHSSAVKGAVSLSGAKILGNAGAGDAPSLLFHGTADGLVPYQWAVNTVDEAHGANLSAFLTTWEGGGHVPYAQHRTEILDQTRNFLYFVLDLAHAPQSTAP